MKKYCSTFLLIFLEIFTLIFIHGKRLVFNPGEIQYVLRITDVKECPSNPKPYMRDMKWIKTGYAQYLSMNLVVEQSFTVGRLMARFERCRDLEIGCEDFQTWNFTKFCDFFHMKNQVWSEIVDSFSPKSFARYCPRFNHGIYKLQNATVDINKLMKFYQEGVKYYWKVYGFVYNRKNELLYCMEIHAHATSFTRRVRL